MLCIANIGVLVLTPGHPRGIAEIVGSGIALTAFLTITSAAVIVSRPAITAMAVTGPCDGQSIILTTSRPPARLTFTTADGERHTYKHASAAAASQRAPARRLAAVEFYTPDPG